MSYIFLQHAAFFFFMAATFLYIVLDGFDLGLGCLHLLGKTDDERRIMLNAVGPVWDGNAVWIVISTGILLAGFPKVFASILSGLYLPFMVIIFGFLFRAAAIEFRSKKASSIWRYSWDVLYSIASMGILLFVGLILGNFIHGLPLDAKGEIIRSKLHFFSGYALVITCFVSLFLMMHGSLYLLMKTEGSFQKSILKLTKILVSLFIVSWIAASIFTFIFEGHMLQAIIDHPPLIFFALFSMFFILSIPVLIKKRFFGLAFLSSAFSIASNMGLYGVGVYPSLVLSTINPEQNNLTLFNSSGTFTSLLVIFIVAVSGAPLSFFYFSYIYRVFRGKVSLSSGSY